MLHGRMLPEQPKTSDTENPMTTLELISWILRGLMLLVGLCYAYQLVYLLVPFFKKDKPHGAEKPLRYAVLISARNEEGVLPYLLESIRAQDYPAERVRTYVCADNCTDGTAEAARACGAAVFERSDSGHIGKGYGLKFLLDRIDPASYDVCLVFDADNLLQPDYIRSINRVFSDGYEAVCGYRNSKNFLENWISSGYALWYVHDCVHLNHSRMLLGVSCAVNGTGFGFTRQLAQRMGGWSFFTLTEDIEFDNWCVLNGVKIGYCPDAMLYDEQPARFGASWRQRIRWMQGSIQLSLKYGGALLKGVFGRRGSRYSCYETLSITIFGYGISIFLGLLTTALELAGNPAMALPLLLVSALTGYLGLFAAGALTMASEWKRIHGSTAKKIACMFSFPLFMFTYIPVALCAPFHKFEWKPTEHRVGVSLDNIGRQKAG